ncbi:hypothetical protein N7462_002713 [Penicillium macrosclerotiorum]|uniref:uncharacterized protein n=1 Tax=Penicillium macrosclerotiorum TaxID=303699 RepID=UPI0025498215|nr:uncharacterized protein N7462_002713 [Penicillium macrosclerotiorum]KAJ5693290.1 hypothetical protein N7462_002713 [Penicillium macrosclerotiorum]
MLSLPFLTPRDSHELWFGSAESYRSSTPQQPGPDAALNQPSRRNGPNAATQRAFMPSRSPANSLASLLAEERALSARKQNIAMFGYSWIRPAGCAKTMLGMKEEEAEREEALAAAAAEMGAVDTEGMMDDDLGMAQGEGEEEEGMERDLDDDIPDADVDVEGEGLIEEGEEGLEGDDIGDEEGYMERDLDDDIPEGYADDDFDEEGLYEDGDFDNHPDLDADIPEAEDGDGMTEGMSRDLDGDIPEAAEDGSEQEEEWQHTDTEEELDDDDDDEVMRTRFTENFRTSTPNSRGGLPPPLLRRERETEAQRRFLQRWSGGGDAFDSSSMMFEEDDLRASITSQSSRRSGFGRQYPRRVGAPRDSLN